MSNETDTPSARLALVRAAVLAVVLLAIAWACRWQVAEVHPGGASGVQGGVYLINRWTGEMRYLFSGEVEIVKAP
jgi:hypothetical protein